MAETFEPKITAFVCNWCTYAGADLTGTSRIKYQPNVRVIRLPCTGRIDFMLILKAFARGSDAVMVSGCHPNDCHYIEGNYKCLRRFRLLRRMLDDMGVEAARCRLEWISASEGDKVKKVINEMVEQVRALGPLDLPGRFRDWDSEVAALEHGAAGASAPCDRHAHKKEAAHA